MQLFENTCKTGFGTWQLGGETTHGGRVTGWGFTDEKEALLAIESGLEQGINFFDTADTYGQGRSETLLGKALKSRHDVFICTKFGNREDANGKAFFDPSAQWLEQATNASLRRLQRDCLDVLLLHSPPDDFDWSRYDPHPFERLIAAGKIRRFGVSSRSIKGAVRVLEHHFGSVIEAIYNALDRRAAERVLPLCPEKNCAFIARVPLASGFLSNKFLHADGQSPAFSANDIRSQLPTDAVTWFMESTLQLAFLDELEGGMAVSALRFCLSHPGVSAVIPGVRKRSHAQDAISAHRLGALPPEVLEAIELAVPEVFPPWR